MLNGSEQVLRDNRRNRNDNLLRRREHAAVCAFVVKLMCHMNMQTAGVGRIFQDTTDCSRRPAGFACARRRDPQTVQIFSRKPECAVFSINPENRNAVISQDQCRFSHRICGNRMAVMRRYRCLLPAAHRLLHGLFLRYRAHTSHP